MDGPRGQGNDHQNLLEALARLAISGELDTWPIREPRVPGAEKWPAALLMNVAWPLAR